MTATAGKAPNEILLQQVLSNRLKIVVMVSLSVYPIADAHASGTSSFKVLHSFCKATNCTDGRSPGGLVFDGNGTLFGTTIDGGTNDSGVVFALKQKSNSTKWNYKVIYNFCNASNCADGQYPYGTLIADIAGNLYGTTTRGGQYGQGTIFSLKRNSRANWEHTIIYSFCATPPCQDGATPTTALTYAGATTGALYDGISPLYGATQSGGLYGQGTAYEIAPPVWKYRTIHSFCKKSSCPDGELPTGLVADSAGNLFGVTNLGGVLDGVAFQLSRAGSRNGWSETVLYKFCADGGSCPDGVAPGAVTLDGSGDVVGTTVVGGGVFRIVPAGEQSQFTLLYRLCSLKDCKDGNVGRGLTVTSSGEIIGVAQNGGGHDIDRQGVGGGTVFKLGGSAFQTLHRFCAKDNCLDGAYPVAAPAVDSKGNVFVTTGEGGKYGNGTLIEIANQK